MTDTSERFRRLAAAFTDRVEAVPAARWDDPSPCEGWVARDVVRHMVDNCKLFLGFVEIEAEPGPPVDEDPVGAWASARDQLQAALDDPETAERKYEGRFGENTLEGGVGAFFCFDLVIHAWDLARATGGDERLDPGDVHQIFEMAKPMDDVMRSSSAFGAKVEPPAGADEQTQLLAFLGRPV